MERQRNERLEAAGLVLEVAEPDEMVDAVGGRLHVAVEHRGVAPQPKLVGRAVDGQPRVGVGLSRGDPAADLGIKNLGPAARQAPQARGDHRLQHAANRQPGPLGQPGDLDRGPCLEVQAGKGRVQAGQNIEVPIKTLVGMDAADDVQFRGPSLRRLAPALEHLVAGHHPGVRIAGVATEAQSGQRKTQTLVGFRWALTL